MKRYIKTYENYQTKHLEFIYSTIEDIEWFLREVKKGEFDVNHQFKNSNMQTALISVLDYHINAKYHEPEDVHNQEDIDAIKLLLDAGADPNIKDDIERSALEYASMDGEDFELFLESNSGYEWPVILLLDAGGILTKTIMYLLDDDETVYIIDKYPDKYRDYLKTIKANDFNL